MLIGPQNLAVHVNHVRSRIIRAALAAGRDPASVTLVAVSKAKPAESVRAAATAGVTDFGENYLQEALGKMDRLADLALHWHFIGGIQSNKTRAIAERFEWVHSVDRLSLARRLAEQRPFHAPALNVCIQVALLPESTKGGVDPAILTELALPVAELPRLRLRGLMCDPAAAARCSGGAGGIFPPQNSPPGPQRTRPRARYTVDGHERRFRIGHCGGRHARANRHGNLRQPLIFAAAGAQRTNNEGRT